jgi:hypothetical protein
MNRLFSATLAILLSSPAILNSQDWDNFNRQMEIFASYTGKWKGYSTLKMPDGWTKTFRCNTDFHFTMDKKYLEGLHSCSDSKEKVHEKRIYTFDPYQNLYRAWIFSSSAVVNEYEGERYNEGIRWKLVGSPNQVTAIIVESVKGKKIKIESTATKPDGQVWITTIGELEKRNY